MSRVKPLWKEVIDVRPGDEAYIINRLAAFHRKYSDRWWKNPLTGRKIKRSKEQLMMLMVSEIAEAMEGYRKEEMDKHLPQFSAESVEMADLFIRLMDYAGELIPNFGEVVATKHAYNMTRVDHTIEARMAKGGKKF